MSAPYPYICLPVLSTHEPLVRGLYALGWTFCSKRNVEEGWVRWKEVVGRGEGASHPYVYLVDGVTAAATVLPRYLPARSRFLTNSIPHFLSYAKRHFRP
jgi:hypothetical protein